MDPKLPFWLLSVILIHSLLIPSAMANVVYVRSSEDINCTSLELCVTLADYAAEQSIVDNTSFIFLPGMYSLAIPLSLVNVSNVSFIGADGPSSEVDAVRVLFSPLVNITFTNCYNVEIRGLTFILNGQSKEDFSAFVFEGSNSLLLNLTLLGSNSMTRGLFLSHSSHIIFNSINASGIFSSRGSVLFGIDSTVVFSGQNSFANNRATYEGGAIALQNCDSTFLGNNSFRNNTATFGGAVSVNYGTYSASGIILFASNTANNGGAMAMTGVSHNSIGNITFIDNVANGSGGAMLISGGNHNISGNVSFVRNSAHLDDLDFRGGGAISMVNGSHCIVGRISFVDNSAPNGNGGALSLSNISGEISGEISFIRNTAMYDGGAMVLFRGTSRISGRNITFVDNSVSSRNGGAMSINYALINISGNSSFLRNTARYEAGALELYRSAGEVSGNSTFINNSISYTYGSGGAVEMDTINGESLILTGAQVFMQNFAERGGAMAFFGRYKLILTSPFKGTFIENRATDYGGAIYFADDTTARVQCAVPYFSRDDCHLELSSLSDITLNFTYN